MKRLAIGLISSLLCGTAALAANLSPGQWPKADRERVEQLEARTASPPDAARIEGDRGMVSTTISPIAAYAGVRALDQGGNAADAAATVALTEISTQLGSVVSYAGIFTLVYYDAKTHKVYSLDAGYNSYLNERDSASIPVADLGPLNFGRTPTVGGKKGRETLTPGFMAGIEAMQHRFGRLPFADLFAPAIWYDEHGVTVSPHLAGFFALRQKFLARTPEGRAFMAQAGGDMPKAGALFVQRDLAETLRGVARHGSAYMYTGPWGRQFVRQVQAEGGAVTPEDLARYRPTWNEPARVEAFGHTIYMNGGAQNGGYYGVAGLGLADASGLAARGPYWSDPVTFKRISQINEVITGAPQLNADMVAFLKAHGVDSSPQALMSPGWARAVAPLMDQIFLPAPSEQPHHSNAIVVVDKEGNIAAITHTINAVIWGDTGIVVGGIPVPDSAAFQQERLAAMRPGDRVTNEIIDTISFKGDKPVLATGSIGSSLVPETLRVLISVLGQHQDLATVMHQPAMLIAFDFDRAKVPMSTRAYTVPQGGYSAAFLEQLKASGMSITETPAATAGGLRGTLAAVAIDPQSGRRTGVHDPNVMIFNAAQ